MCNSTKRLHVTPQLCRFFFHSTILGFCLFDVLHSKMCFASFFTQASGHWSSLHVSARFRSTLCEQNLQNSVSPDTQKSFEKCWVRNFFFFIHFVVFSPTLPASLVAALTNSVFEVMHGWFHALVLALELVLATPQTKDFPVSPENRISEKQWSVPWYSLFNNRFSFYRPLLQLQFYNRGNLGPCRCCLSCNTALYRCRVQS